MSAYRVDIRRLILSSTRDLRASVLFRFAFREEGCFWSLGPVDLPVRRDVGCAGAMAPIPTGAHLPCFTWNEVIAILEVLCHYARPPVEMYPVSLHCVSLRLTSPTWYHRIHEWRQQAPDPENLEGPLRWSSEEHIR